MGLIVLLYHWAPSTTHDDEDISMENQEEEEATEAPIVPAGGLQKEPVVANNLLEKPSENHLVLPSTPINPHEPFTSYKCPVLLKKDNMPSNSVGALANTFQFRECNMKLPLILGETIDGDVRIVDLANLHSLLIIGKAKSGKSSLIESMILSLLLKKHPNEIKFVMMDMNKDSLTKFSKISNQFMAAMEGQEEAPVIINNKAAYDTLNSLNKLIDVRATMLKKARAKNIKEYNDKYINRQLTIAEGHKFLPSIIVIIDEFGGLMTKEAKPLFRLCLTGAFAGIYVIASTKRATPSVINQNIEDAFQGKIIFKCTPTGIQQIELPDDIEQPRKTGECLYINGDNASKLQGALPTADEIMEVSDEIYVQPGPVGPMLLPSISDEQDNLDPLFEEAARIVVSSQVASTALLQRRFSIGYSRAGRIMDQLQRAGIVGEATGAKPRAVLITKEEALKTTTKDVKRTIPVKAQPAQPAPSAYQLFQKDYVFSSNDENKRQWSTKLPHRKSYVSENRVQQNHFQEELKSLIGLNSVKEEITTLANFIKLNQKRSAKGLPMAKISFHCVFTGNSGTGKTTVARLLAGIFKELGVLKKGQLIETDRSGLVAEYIGQTAVKTNKIIDSALDGVLFIDEAYTLSQGGNQDYGREAIATLLKRMEDDRDRLVVVLAGYGKEMRTFIDSNPGLKSRFNRYINFPDYSSEELMDILKLYLSRQQYVLSNEAEEFVKTYLSNVISEKRTGFGNARFVRNLFEKTIEQQANRLAEAIDCDEETLKLIDKEDILKGIEHLS